MPLPATVRATVDPAMIEKVGRLFNGTLDDVLGELFQNARRAGATRIGVSVVDLDGRRVLAVVDNGAGIDDPAALLSLGRSGWDGATARREDPAGIGFFSLAGRAVEVRSRPRTAKTGWRMAITPDAWDTACAIAVTSFGIAGGTEILIDLAAEWQDQLERAVTKAARYLPLTVLRQCIECQRDDWLAGAIRVEHWEGSRIGVFAGDAPRSSEPTINFHGLVVPCPLATLAEADTRRSWHARLDVGDTPSLQLVLPARKEVVRTAFLDKLRAACEAAVFRAAAAGPHRLGHADYLRGRALGVELDEAEPRLHGWHAPTAAYDQERAPLTTGAMLLMPELEPALAQTAARAIALGGMSLPSVVGHRAFEGYGWYDALDRVRHVRLSFVRDGTETTVTGDEDVTIASGTADQVTVEFAITGADGSERIQACASDVAVIAGHDLWYGLDDAALLVVPDAAITVPELVDLLVRAVFSPSDDHGSDSYETQQEHFEQAALKLARTHLIGEDAAVTGSARDRVREHVCWLVPDGRTLVITATHSGAEAVFLDAPLAASDEAGFVDEIASLATIDDPAQAAAALGAIREACAARRTALLTRAAAAAS